MIDTKGRMHLIITQGSSRIWTTREELLKGIAAEEKRHADESESAETTRE